MVFDCGVTDLVGDNAWKSKGNFRRTLGLREDLDVQEETWVQELTQPHTGWSGTHLRLC